MRAVIILLAVAATLAGQTEGDKWPEYYDAARWPVFFSGAIEKSATICVEVSPEGDSRPPRRAIEYELSLVPKTQVRLFIDGEQRLASQEPVSSLKGKSLSAGKHTLEILVGSPADRARLTIMSSSKEGYYAGAVRLCGEASPPALTPKDPGTIMPVVKSTVEPLFPESARKHGIKSGRVKISATVGTDGKIHEIQVVLSGGADFDSEAIDAVRRWKFTPGTVDGKPAPVTVHLDINIHTP